MTDILSEEFTMPGCVLDLDELIDETIETYRKIEDKKIKTAYRAKVNLIIKQANEKSNSHRYNFL